MSEENKSNFFDPDWMTQEQAVEKWPKLSHQEREFKRLEKNLRDSEKLKKLKERLKEG